MITSRSQIKIKIKIYKGKLNETKEFQVWLFSVPQYGGTVPLSKDGGSSVP